MLITHMLPLSCYRKKRRICPTSTMVSKFAKFESSWLQRVGTIARGVQNTHHWSGRTETATKNGVGKAESCRRCDSHSSVASLIAPDQWCLFCTSSLATFSTHCYQPDSNLANWGLGGINSGVYFCNKSMVARTQWAFQVSQDSVETLFRWRGKRLHHFAANLFRKYQIRSESPEFCRICYKTRIWFHFFPDTVYSYARESWSSWVLSFRDSGTQLRLQGLLHEHNCTYILTYNLGGTSRRITYLLISVRLTFSNEAHYMC